MAWKALLEALLLEAQAGFRIRAGDAVALVAVLNVLRARDGVDVGRDEAAAAGQDELDLSRLCPAPTNPGQEPGPRH